MTRRAPALILAVATVLLIGAVAFVLGQDADPAPLGTETETGTDGRDGAPADEGGEGDTGPAGAEIGDAPDDPDIKEPDGEVAGADDGEIEATDDEVADTDDVAEATDDQAGHTDGEVVARGREVDALPETGAGSLLTGLGASALLVAARRRDRAG